MSTALDNFMQQDIRKQRATHMAHLVLSTLRDFIPDATWSQAHDRLIEQFMRDGIEILTDYDRERLGLPARDPNGWTPDEIRALEHLRLESMMPSDFSVWRTK